MNLANSFRQCQPEVRNTYLLERNYFLHFASWLMIRINFKFNTVHFIDKELSNVEYASDTYKPEC